VGELRYFTSGPVESFRRALEQLGVEIGEVRAARWECDEIKEA
jgi:hypothetical protein